MNLYGDLILGVNTLYRLFCYFKLFFMVSKGLTHQQEEVQNMVSKGLTHQQEEVQRVEGTQTLKDGVTNLVQIMSL